MLIIIIVNFIKGRQKGKMRLVGKVRRRQGMNVAIEVRQCGLQFSAFQERGEVSSICRKQSFGWPAIFYLCISSIAAALLVLKCKISPSKIRNFSQNIFPLSHKSLHLSACLSHLPFPPAWDTAFICRDYNNQFQSQRKMTSQQVANYLNQLGSNQRKLEYCRQILAEHRHFTPDAVFNMNSKTPANTLYRSQFVDLLKRIGVDLKEAQVLRVFEYFQVDGKNYVTLEEFSGLMLPHTANGKKTAQNQRENKLVLDYSLKFSLQKYFKQVLDNQTKAEQLACFTLEAKQASKLKYRKIDSASIKNFLASHGKYPTDSVIDSIHKEISLNKGSSKRNKSIVDYVLQYNEIKGNNIPKAQGCENKEGAVQNEVKKLAPNEQKQAKEKAITARPTVQERNALQQRQWLNTKALCDISSGVINKPITREASFKPVNPNIQANNVESRIKTLMGSINIKPSAQRSTTKQEKISEQENIKNQESRITVSSSKADQTFSRVSISEKVSASKAITDRLANMNIFLDQDEDKKELNLPSTLLLTKKTSSIVEEQPKDAAIIRPRTRTSTFIENRKENASVLSSCQPNQKARRLDYLRSLVDQDSKKRGVLTFRS